MSAAIAVVKIVPDMTYNMFGGTLNLAQLVSSRQSTPRGVMLSVGRLASVIWWSWQSLW